MKLQHSITVFSPEEMEKIIPDLCDWIGHRKKLALYGELGAGKTTFTQAFCRFFNVQEAPSSPTFSLVNQYTYMDGEGVEGKIFHLDLYRLRTLDEALDIGIEDMLYDKWYTLIEWPQVIEPLLGDDHVKIQFEIVSKTERRMLILYE